MNLARRKWKELCQNRITGSPADGGCLVAHEGACLMNIDLSNGQSAFVKGKFLQQRQEEGQC